MELTWRERLMQEPEWWQFARWPFLDTHSLPPESRRAYHRNVQIVASVLSGDSLKNAAHAAQVSPARVTQLMHRCLAGDEDSPPALTQGLVPHQRLKQSSRKAALSSLTNSLGDRCAFEFLLAQVPGLHDHLTKQIRRAVHRNRRGQNLTARRFHAGFISYLIAQNWPQDTYPFTSVSRGYESVRRFLARTQAELRMPRQGQRVIGPKTAPIGAFQEIHIDEAHVDCHGAAAVVLHNRMKPIRLGRISLLLARDVATGAFLAATFALTPHPSSADVLALLEQLVQPWTPLTLTAPGLSYTSTLGFPSALGESFCRPAFGIVRLDNALAHLSHQVRRMVCDHLSATCNFGLPKNPKARALIEQAFRRLNIDIHRFPSTTGSHPTDPLREPTKLQKEPPFVSLQALEEAITVLVVEYNHSPLANMGGVTPMEQMQYQMANHLLPLRATSLGPGLGPFERATTVTVRKGFTADAPRINFAGCQYEGVALNSARLINEKVSVVLDIRDIRELRVFTLEGKRLGTVTAPRTWLRFAHSVAMRKRILRLVREHVLSTKDPLGGFYDYMLAHQHLPRNALTLVGMSQERPVDAPAISPPPTSSDPIDEINPDLDDALKKLPDWSPTMAKKRR